MLPRRSKDKLPEREEECSKLRAEKEKAIHKYTMVRHFTGKE